jgi:YegS/Rv2252/BmrU family lipid kinase
MAEERLGSFATCFTSGVGDARRIARQQLLSGADLIISVGGDGTINEIVNGFMDSDSPIRKEARLGIIPCGTGCDLARTILASSSPDRALKAIAEGHIRSMDLGRVRFTGHDGLPGVRYFHNVASFGIGGEVVAHVNGHSKALGPFLSFVRSSLICLLKHGTRRLHLKIDNGVAEEYVALNVAVANGRCHGGGMCVAPDAVIDDGLFQLTIIGDLTMPEVFLNFTKFYNGRIKEVRKVLTLTCRHIEATSEQRIRLDLDGEQPGWLPAVIDIAPGALPVIVDGEMFSP